MFFVKNNFKKEISSLKEEIISLRNEIDLIKQHILLLSTKPPPAPPSPIPYSKLPECNECGLKIENNLCKNINCPNSIKNIFI